MRRGRLIARQVAIVLGVLVAGSGCGFALNPALEISQYAHNAWTVQNGFSLGNIYAMAQTPDGYLWLGSEFGLFRFDGAHFDHWQPPTGQELPTKDINALLVTRDGTLWIGTFAGLASLKNGKLTQHPEVHNQFVASLFEDRDGTVWVGTLGSSGQLCAIRDGSTEYYGQSGELGRAVWAFYEDGLGTLWAATQSGLWRIRPGPQRRYATPIELIGLSKADNGRLLIAMHGSGLLQLAGDRLEPHPIRGARNSIRPLPDREVDANRLLRDRDGGLWIGTVERGLIHVHQGRTDVFTRADGLSGDVILSVFEDREGNVWVASTGGLDRFRELPVATVSVKQGLSSDATHAVLAAMDGSIWIGAHEGLTRWKDGQVLVFGKASGLPDALVPSLFQDAGGRVWVFTDHGLAYFKDGRFIGVNPVPGGESNFITGDKAGNLWISATQGLLHFREGRLVEQIPWSAFGRNQQASVILPDRDVGGVWLGFWNRGGVSYFKNGQARASNTAADGLGKGPVQDLRIDSDGAVWAATLEGGLSRIKDGGITTLTTQNGLPCDAIHWSIADDDRSLWLYTACGLVRITRSEVDRWIADPQRGVETTVWDAADGVKIRSSAASAYGPRVAKSTDGKIWFVTGEGVQVIDPHRLALNKLPPPVHIEQVIGDRKVYWENLTGGAVSNSRLPPRLRDLQIDYTAPSLVAPQKIRFKYRLEGYDREWQEAGNRRQAFYSNLPPGRYRFRVIACNNSGVWNETGDSLEFSIAPAYFQTNWFLALCVAIFLALLWAAYRLRVGQLEAQEKKFREAVETMPALAFIALPDGNRTFLNRGWVEYAGMTVEQASGYGWQAAVHPSDLKQVIERWRTSAAKGEAVEYEVRLRRGADGRYRWFEIRAAPLRDKRGKVVKWCGVATDIEDRKRADQLQAELTHSNRVSMLGELATSIAHEVNQPLSGIVSNGSACLRFLAGDAPNLEEARDAARDIVRDGKRAGEIIARIRALTKRAATPREKLDLNETIREVLALVGDEARGKSVTIRTQFADDLSPVSGDRVQLQQVVLNLVMNAIEAMGSAEERAQELVITTRNIDQDQVQVTVEDSGVGIDPQMIDKIFDSFYTTKPGGMGMGLSISRSILQAHGGRLWATDKDGPGTSFDFTLPKYQAGAADA